MAKLKAFSGRKKCLDGEVYKFKNGVTIVPGMLFWDEPWGWGKVRITFTDFVEELKNGKTDETGA